METPHPHPKPSRRTPLGLPPVVIGGVVALLLGLGLAMILVMRDRAPSGPPPASQGGLVIEAGQPDDARSTAGKPLRCFVQGRFVGELTLTDCAQRNGVATDALDVGIDETGALAAANQAGEMITPLPPEEGTAPPQEVNSTFDEAPAPAEEVAQAPACWKYGGGRWRKLPGDLGLDACVHALFAGRCEKPGGATYGRFGAQTLRLVAGKVEISDDNRAFRTLAAQAPDCSLPPVG